MIIIKCDLVNGTTAVPSDIIDKHLKLASAASFKVLLFILRNPEGTSDAEQIALCTGLTAEDVEYCLEFWQANGVIEINDTLVAQEDIKKTIGNVSIQSATETEATEEKPQKMPVKALPYKRPTQGEIALRLGEDETLSSLFREAQLVLGTFGYDTQALLLMMYDYYGFSAETIMLLLNYQASEKRLAGSYLKKRAEDWAKRGIDNFDMAEHEVCCLEKIRKVYEEIKAVGDYKGDIPAPKIEKAIRTWAVELGCSSELIKFALNRSNLATADTTKLLKKWVNSDITTPEQVLEREARAIPGQVEKTYNTQSVGKSSVMDWIKKYEQENK